MNKTFYVASWEGGVFRVDYDFDRETASQPEKLTDTSHASYFAKSGNMLYVLSENPGPGDFEGTISSFSIETDGGLKPVDMVPGIPSGSPHLTLGRDEKYIYAASYENGKVCSLENSNGRFGRITSVLQQTGSSILPDRQEGPHAHIMCLSPKGDRVFCCDLGTDLIHCYRIREDDGGLEHEAAFKVPAGYGPRHMLFSKDGAYAYVLCELQYRLLVYSHDGKGGLKLLKNIKVLPGLPEDKNWGGAIKLSSDGRQLFTTNRAEGFSSVDVLSLDNPGEPERVGSLTDCEHVRDFLLLEEKGKKYIFAASMTRNRLRMFEYNPDKLSFRLMTEIRGINKPVCFAEA